MFKKKIIFIILIAFATTSCGETLSSVKRGMTGEKNRSTDEFMIKKKDPLILPPDFEKLPTPKEQMDAKEEAESFKKILKKIQQPKKLLLQRLLLPKSRYLNGLKSNKC